MVKKYVLRLQGRKKRTVEVDDLYDVLRTLWMSEKMRFESSAYFSANDQRADNWLGELVKSYTGYCPGSLVEGKSAEGYPMVDEWDAGVEDATLPTYADCHSKAGIACPRFALYPP